MVELRTSPAIGLTVAFCLILVPALLKTASPIIIRGPFFCQSFWGGVKSPLHNLFHMRFNDIPIMAKLILLAEVAGIIPLTMVAVWSVIDTMRSAESLAHQANQGVTRLIRDEIDRHELLLRNWVTKLDHPDLTPEDLINHAKAFSLFPIGIYNMTKVLRLKGNYAYVIWSKKKAVAPSITGEQIW